MCGNGLEIQEIKRRLAANGQDIDEDVISDFLENCDFVGITDKISHIIRIISEKDDFQNSLDIMGTSSSSESHYASDSTSEYSSSMESTNVKVIDISSDSDDDTDYYHHNTSNMNDTSVIDTLKIAANDITTSCSYLQPNDNKSLLNQDVDVVTDVAVDVVTDGDSQVTTANSKTQVSEVSIPEITILEEKNDVTCIKSTSKVPKATVLEENNNDVAYVKSIFKMEDPKPGCSKDPDAPALPPVLEDLCSFSVSDELQKDARIIHALLPNFNYSLIYRTLCNNHFAKNCIELTLWDLLPEKRPAIQPLNKRKCSNEICPIQCKKSLKTSVHKDQMDTKATLKEKPVRAKRKEIIDIKSRNKEFASDGTDEMETNVFAKVTPLNIDNNTDQSIVPVRKTKLNYTSNIPNKNIEFSYDINPIHSKLLKDIDDMESTKIREPLEIKSIFSDDALGSSTASSEMFNIDNFLEAFLEPPIEDVSDPFLQVKRKDLGEKAQARTETRVVDVKSENKESTLMTDKTDEIKNKNIWEEKIKNSSLVDVEKNASKVMIKENNGDLKPLHVITLHEKASQIYAKLIPMFPDVKASFIKALCFKGIQPDDLRDEAILLELLVDALLNYNKKNLLIKNVEPAATVKNSNETLKTPDLNEQYADLLMIFPEADPVYLREIAEQMYKNPEQIKEFVQSKLENPDYPTRAQYLAKKKLTEQQKQYTTDFQVQQFLELFPDPFSYFEDEKRKCQFNPHAVDFLKHYFSKLKVNTLVNTYSQYVHNLSLTAKALEALNPDLKTKRYSSKTILTEDIPFLQECAFIQHKAELRKYLDEMKAKEEQEFNELKAKNELLECQCCYDNECMPSKCSTCAEGHIFCNSCIIRSTDIVLADGNTHVKCLLNCGCDFPISVLQKILSPTKFSILLCKQQEAEVMAAGVEGLVSCPFCHFASIPPPEDKIFKCLNPECMKESCRLCKEINHIPLKCNEKKSEAARLYLEEKMTEALVRKCYRCNRMFFKEEGCNKMTCLCGAKMCYICDKPVTDYRHFQGQGATGSNLCPLWSDNRRLNAESVIKVCKETMKQIKEKDPKVDINIERLLPKLPPKSKGPHEDIPQFNRMMEHADRIARHIP
ncbi:E3 ubiquitin-protein ligase RNF216-like [Pogonomyrmex barbatus]|uniref:E3 ubiquitin-protein ligase RNF216-like n=1 Tax=Pogonomyrmex barbatus TaxID=144034 RepID=A0A6I9X175_9HYME|nr:E3 ubiquitin-protein ligase RNF216-like [Pogonomyrmex barbatus]